MQRGGDPEGGQDVQVGTAGRVRQGAVEGQGAQVVGGRPAAHRVQDGVDPAPVSALTHLGHHVLGLVVNDLVRAQGAHVVQVGRRGRGNDPGPQVTGQLDGVAPHPSGAAGDQEAAARGQRQAGQRLVGGHGGAGQGGGVLGRDPLGDPGQGAGVHHHVVGVAPAAAQVVVEDHAAAHAQLGDGRGLLGPLPHGLHGPGHVQAQHVGPVPGVVAAAGGLDVHRVQATGVDPHQHLTGAGLGDRDLCDVKGLRVTGGVENKRAHGHERHPVMPRAQYRYSDAVPRVSCPVRGPRPGRRPGFSGTILGACCERARSHGQ